MPEQTGKILIMGLHRRWRRLGILLCLLFALAVTILIGGVLSFRFGLPSWTSLIVLAAAGVVSARFLPYWRVSVNDIASHMDRSVPELEDSTGLLLTSPTELNGLHQLQATRIEPRLVALRPAYPARRLLYLGGAALLLASLISLILWQLSMQVRVAAYANVHDGSKKQAVPIPPGLRQVHIRVMPPAYTGRPARTQEDPDLQLEEGALVSWQLIADSGVKSIRLIFNDSLKVAARPDAGDNSPAGGEASAGAAGLRSWHYSTKASFGGFYRMDIDGKLSPIYKIGLVRDAPPSIQVRHPAPYTIIDFGASLQVPLSVHVQDDYAVAGATIQATIASGSGEAVKFREQTLHFSESFAGRRSAYELGKTLDLGELGLHPGDELYFYIRANDNHGQETRSDMIIISLPDTAQLMSLAGMTTGVNVKPEFFRSERQIILETEQLLREKDTIPLQRFHDRSNDLGIDQKLLRLRYGKFLGEESEEGSNDPDHAPDLGGPGDFGKADKILDAFTDKHDNAEDATYFEPALKAQLKATLTEMWNAELRLRTYRPQEALPFAYKALRLLKDLQQKSRAYVAKTGVRITAPDPGKRLSGKLEDIGQPGREDPNAYTPPPGDVLRIVLALLDSSARQGLASQPAQTLLRQAGRQIAREATARPAEFVDAYQTLQRILDQPETASAKDLALVQQAIARLVPPAEPAPAPGAANPDERLSGYYYRELNENSKRK